MNQMNRRNFLKTSALTAAGLAVASSVRAEEAAAPVVVVVHGTDVPKMITAGIEKLGGWKAFVKPGAKVVVKPNAAWNSKPEEGGNTNPEVVAAVTRQVIAAGAKSVNAPEISCHPFRQTFATSGIQKAIEDAGGRIYPPAEFAKVDIPKGKILKNAEIPKEMLECDCLINLPAAKHHGGAMVTLSMKNWMGTDKNRGSWHRLGLHQCIADFSTFLKPHLVIIDATRLLLNRGPQGPGDLAHPKEIIFSRDPVAADAYAASLFVGQEKAAAKIKAPFDVPHIKMAHEMGVGCGDLSRIKIERVEV